MRASVERKNRLEDLIKQFHADGACACVRVRARGRACARRACVH